MSTYRYRGDLRTTGDQLRLRDGGSGANKKPVEVKADDNDTEIILKAPSNDSLSTMDDGTGGDAGKKLDTIVTRKATEELSNKTINADSNAISELELDNLKDGVLIDSAELVIAETDNIGDTSGGNHIPADADDTMLLSALAIKTYVDARDAEQDEAIETTFDPANSDLEDTNVQDAIDTIANATITGDDSSTAGGGNLTENRVITIKENPTIPGVEYMLIPKGDESQRPTSPLQAMVRYNTDTNQVEKYDGSEWAQVGGGGLEVVLASADISPAEVSTHYLVNTGSSARTITLPLSSSLSSADTKKAVIRITDIGENASANNITINAGAGDSIKMDGEAAASSLTFDVDGTWIQLALSGTTWYVDDVFWNNVSDSYNQAEIDSLISDFITLTDLSVGPNAPASGSGSLAYNNTSGAFTFTPPDLSPYLTSEANNLTSSVTWATVPNAYISQSSVTQHQASLSLTASQVTDFDTEVANNADVTANTAKVSADGSINTHSDVDTSTSSPTVGDVLKWNGSAWVPGVAGVEIYSPAPGTISVSIASHYVLDTSSGAYTLTLPDSSTLSASDTKVASIRIVDKGNNADVNNITINASGSDTILLGELYTTGAIADDAQLVFDVPGKWIELVLSGTKWVVEGTFI